MNILPFVVEIEKGRDGQPIARIPKFKSSAHGPLALRAAGMVAFLDRQVEIGEEWLVEITGLTNSGWAAYLHCLQQMGYADFEKVHILAALDRHGKTFFETLEALLKCADEVLPDIRFGREFGYGKSRKEWTCCGSVWVKRDSKAATFE